MWNTRKDIFFCYVSCNDDSLVPLLSLNYPILENPTIFSSYVCTTLVLNSSSPSIPILSLRIRLYNTIHFRSPKPLAFPSLCLPLSFSLYPSYLVFFLPYFVEFFRRVGKTNLVLIHPTSNLLSGNSSIVLTPPWFRKRSNNILLFPHLVKIHHGSHYLESRIYLTNVCLQMGI